MAFHHDHKMVLGKVLDMKEVAGKGLWVKARVDGAIARHPVLGTIYEQIKNETLSSLSLGGFFKRAATAAGTRIVDMDFVELSVTGTPTLAKGTSFSVVAGKALQSTYVPDAQTPGERVQSELIAANLELAVMVSDLTLTLLEQTH